MRFPIATLIGLSVLLSGCEGGRKEPPPAPVPTPESQPAAPAAQPPAAPASKTTAVSGALGSKTNPIRCDYPAGERAYLSRLRCPDGSKPTFDRAGSVGKGPYGNILDLYQVKCGGKTCEVFMDMYFKGYVEKSPVPGFTIVR